ncbi:APC family permease [Dactylosporangium darangshiense]|uniref:APC family permease n=1 Tax=Dactylosporangium darangshiense TaxID=579108 RepID=A0ABP8DTY8_9ACTN
MPGAVKPGLVRGLVSPFAVWQFQVGASSPLTVVVGGVVTTYAVTGVVGVPLTFPIIGVCLGLLSVGFLAMSYRQRHAGAAYAAMAVGLGPRWGVAGGFIALVSYPALQIALLGLFGVNMADFAGTESWQVWAWVAWLLLAAVGTLRYTLGQYTVAGITIVELAVITMMSIAAFVHPHDGHITTSPLTVSALWADQGQIGGAFALGVAAFVGFETGPAFSEEIKDERSVVSASVLTLVFLTGFLTVVAWSLAVWTGADRIVAEATSALPFDIISRYWGATAGTVMGLLLISSVYISMLSFHNTTNRYAFAMARERVLPRFLARVGRTGGRFEGTPWPASLVQSGLVAAALAVFQLAGANPMEDMFVWLSSGAAFAILAMLVLVSVAAVLWFRSGAGGAASVWIRTVLPIVGAVAGTVLAAIIALNQSLLLQLDPGSGWQLLIPACAAAVVAAGLLYGAWIKGVDPVRYAGIGRGQPDPRTEIDTQLGAIRG